MSFSDTPIAGYRTQSTLHASALRASLATIVLALTISHTPATQAQSVDSCMSARLVDALKTCQAIIDSGSRNADVYWKLSSALHQNGQSELARETLSKALSLHPGNAKLSTLRDIILSDATEQELIARSAQLNQSSIDRGAMKIACLTKTGDLGISACKRRLELTDVDGDRMRERLATLTSAQSATRIATTSVSSEPEPLVEAPKPNPVTAIPTPKPTVTNAGLLDSQPDANQLAADARKAAYTRLVAEIQSRLNDFGFNAGLPDGIPGNRTYQALSNFYTASGLPGETSISDLTLEDLIAAEGPFKTAETLLQESRLALTDNNVQLAVQKLNTAKKTSGLIQIPANLERDIQSSLIAKQEPAIQSPSPAPLPRQEPQPTISVAQAPAAPSNNANNAQTFSALMTQIKTLQGQIQRQQEDHATQLNRLRGAL